MPNVACMYTHACEKTKQRSRQQSVSRKRSRISFNLVAVFAVFTRLSLATSVSWKEKGGNEYKTPTEWHRIICWNKLAEWIGTLQKGAYVEIEGELRYRDYTPAEADRRVRVAEIHSHSILALDRSDRQSVSAAESEPADEPLD